MFSGPISSDKAKDKLGFKPTEMDEAFKETIKWYHPNFIRIFLTILLLKYFSTLCYCRYDDLFIRDEAEREEMIKTFIGNVVPR